MLLTVNSQIQQVDGPISVAELLASMRIPAGGTAVAVNNRLVPATDRDTKMLSDGDNVVIIGAAYGG